MQKIAFFDIDGTVFRSSLLIQLVEALVSEGIFPANAKDEYSDAYVAWVNREGTYEDYISSVVDTYVHHIKGVHYGTLADIGKIVIVKQGKRVYRYTRDLIKELKDKNYYVVAISQSPKTILDEFCNGYGFDKVYGRMYELGPQDLFTGKMIDVHLIEDKANIIRRVLEGENFTSDDSVGVGDTEGDISLLDMVAKPICFNPNAQLYEHAKKVGWSVVVERKDVIYEL